MDVDIRRGKITNISLDLNAMAYMVLDEGLINKVRNVIELRLYTVFPFQFYLRNNFKFLFNGLLLRK
jgi:hypothetical protein